MGDIATERRGKVAWIRLQRAERRNAYDAEMGAELLAAIRDAEDARVVVITGSGGSFCAGGFLRDLATASRRELRGLFHTSLQLFDTIRTSPRPVIAAVNGFAVGGGNELVVACDLALAGESAIFGQNGVRIGSAPVLGGTNLLAMNIGEKRAKEVSMLCRRYPAREALSLGWINAVIPDEQLEEEVTRWAAELIEKSPRYLAIAKASANVWWNSCRESFVSGLGMLEQAIGSHDMLEGSTAFLERRQAQFEDWP